MYHRTALVIRNNDCKDFYFRERNCDTNLTSFTSANQYQRLKLIQNTVRVPSSLYTMNLGSLTAGGSSCSKQWNQMSDRILPSRQPICVTRGNSTKHTTTGPRPGAQSPGGVGCDIKHNSYDRYLNKIKGREFKRPIIAPLFGLPIPFNRAFPVYGGKTISTQIIPCKEDKSLYENRFYQELPDVGCIFQVGQYVYTLEGDSPYFVKALIVSKTVDDIFTVEFEDLTTETKTCNELFIYFDCDCPTDTTNYEDKNFLSPVVFGIQDRAVELLENQPNQEELYSYRMDFS